MFHRGNRTLQARFDSARIADRIVERFDVEAGRIGERDRALIERADMFFIATADEQGRPNCSYKGGEPGFVRVLDEHTIAFPNYDGNGMFLTAGNVLVNPHVGLLFISFEEQTRLRLNGTASHDEHDELLRHYPEAKFVTRVSATEVFPNCPRYVHRYELVERSTFVPRKQKRTPVPAWKCSEWAVDALPEGDPALAADATVVHKGLTEEER